MLAEQLTLVVIPGHRGLLGGALVRLDGRLRGDVGQPAAREEHARGHVTQVEAGPGDPSMVAHRWQQQIPQRRRHRPVRPVRRLGCFNLQAEQDLLRVAIRTPRASSHSTRAVPTLCEGQPDCQFRGRLGQHDHLRGFGAVG